MEVSAERRRPRIGYRCRLVPCAGNSQAVDDAPGGDAGAAVTAQGRDVPVPVISVDVLRVVVVRAAPFVIDGGLEAVYYLFFSSQYSQDLLFAMSYQDCDYTFSNTHHV